MPIELPRGEVKQRLETLHPPHPVRGGQSFSVRIYAAIIHAQHGNVNWAVRYPGTLAYHLMTTENPDSLITVKNSLITQPNSLFNAKNSCSDS
jgi:hypothetical protein